MDDDTNATTTTDAPVVETVTLPVSKLEVILKRLDELEARVQTDEDSLDPQFGPCTRCDYGPWRSRRKPKCCPKCRSAYWDRERRNITASPARSWRTKETRNMQNARTSRSITSTPSASTTPTSTPRSVILPRELRPPGEELIPPPPRIMSERPLAETLAHLVSTEPEPPPPTPVEHIAPMPDFIVEEILSRETGQAGSAETHDTIYNEIKTAKEADNVLNVDTATEGDTAAEVPSPVAEVRGKPVDANLQAKKDAFFAEFAVPAADQPAPEPDSSPFVAPSDAAIADKAREKDDPFWK